MSKTIRVSDELYSTLDEAREKNQTFQDIIGDLAAEAGLFPSEIHNADDLREKLQVEYGFTGDEVRSIADALRLIYTGQEQEDSIGVPHEWADRDFEDDIDTLIRLKLAVEEHYTGKYDYGYRTTSLGEDIGSELVRELLDEKSHELEELFDQYDDALLSVFIRFGYKKTDTGHLSNRSAPLAGRYTPDIWDITELLNKYREFNSKLDNLGVSTTYDGRRVLPPEFREFVNRHDNADLEPIMTDVEIYQVLLDYAEGELESRQDIVNQLDAATEEEFVGKVEEFFKADLTSRYQVADEAPLLIKNSEGLRDRIDEEIKSMLNVE